MPPSVEDLIARLRREVAELSPTALANLREAADPPIVLDVREPDEVAAGQVPGAIPLSRGYLELRADQVLPDRSRPIVTYCGGGHRSLFAAEALSRLGYTHVSSLAGGFARWKAEGRPVHVPPRLAADDRDRYSRHLAIPEVGESGQRRLLSAKVLLVGAGGLGSPAALYLAAAGVGVLGLVDDDLVEASNLQRQVLHGTDRIGLAKVDSARLTLRNLNPGIDIQTHRERLTVANAERLIGAYDVIVDGADNFPTRYLVNDACVLLRKPCVHGSIYRFEGQVSVFDPPHGPCYRCIYPEPPPPEQAPSCAEAGVLGVLPGTVGLLQSVEVVKLILGIGEPLRGRLLHYDALGARFREFKVQRNETCRVCGDGVVFPGFVDYEGFCSGGSLGR